jgi:glycosyltransferase involved in cell wall biosynthesis
MGGSLRIAVWYNLPSGGAKRALHDHVRGLVERGHDVEVFCPTTADPSYLPLSRYAKEHILPYERRPLRGGGPGRLLNPYREVLAELRAMDDHCRLCAGEIEAGGFDLLFANNCSISATSPIGRHVGIPSVLYLQDPNRMLYEARPYWDMTRLLWAATKEGASFYTPRGGRNGFIERLRRRKWEFHQFAADLATAQGYRIRAREEALDAQAFDRVLCNSYFSRESLLRCYGVGARVCYLGIDEDAFRPSPAKEPYVVGLGQVGYQKGVDAAIRALATIPRSSRPRLVWIGNSARNLDEFHALADSLGVAFEVRMMVTQEELVDLLGRAAVMIYAPQLEPFGYAPLEANSCGTPVVAAAEGGVRETIRTGVNGVLVEPADHVALGRAVAEYTQDLDRSRDDGARARRHVLEHWNLRLAIDRLEAHLIEVASSGGNGRPGGVADALPHEADILS